MVLNNTDHLVKAQIITIFHWLSREVHTRNLPVNLQRKSPLGSYDEYLKSVTSGMDTMMDHQGKTHPAALLQLFIISFLTKVKWPQFILCWYWLMGSSQGWWGPHGVDRAPTGLTGLAGSLRGCYGAGGVAKCLGELPRDCYGVSGVPMGWQCSQVFGGVSTGLVGSPQGWQGPQRVGRVPTGLLGSPQGWQGPHGVTRVFTGKDLVVRISLAFRIVATSRT